MKRILIVLTIAAFVFSAGYAFAQGSATSNMDVSTNVQTGCTITATPLAFPVYWQGQATDNDWTATVTVNCPAPFPYSIELGSGNNPGAYPQRNMNFGASLLSYQIFQDAARITVWALGPADDINGIGTGVGQNYTAFGRIPAFQVVPIGAYSDVVVATIWW